MDNYLDFLKDKESMMIDMIKQVVEIESPTHHKKQNDYLGNMLRELFEQFTGGKTRIVENEEFGNHIIGEIGEGDEQILIVGHFDTVHPIGTIKRNPFRIEEGKVYGPGIYDMKTGLVQAIFALHALTELQMLKDKKIVCIFNSDEELGSKTSRQLIVEEAKKSKFAFVLEPSFGEDGAIKIARKGVASYIVKASGVPAHAGNSPEEGVSAIEEISHQVLELQALNDYEAGITVNCGIINGGSAKNTIPEYAELKVDVRVPTISDSKKIHQYITQLEPINDKVELEIKGGFTRPPMEKDEESEQLYQMAKTMMKKHCNEHLPKAFVGGASDGNYTSLYTATLDGLGAVGDGAHSIDEYIFIDHLVSRTALLAALIEKA